MISIICLPSALSALQFRDQPRGKGFVVLSQPRYSVGYSASLKFPLWTFYVLTAQQLRAPKVKRAGSFSARYAITARSKEFTHSGYDRGHLVPAASMAFSHSAMKQSFDMMNVSAQVPGFNRGIWKKAEEKTRCLARQYGKVEVSSGGVGREGSFSGISVPKFFFKAIYIPSQERMIAFYLPNKKSSERLIKYLVSVDMVEKKSALDLFPALPDKLEKRLEKKSLIVSKICFPPLPEDKTPR